VLKIRISDLTPAASRLNGATVGEAHAEQVRILTAAAGVAEGDIVVLDFAGIESASASYLKRLLNPFFDRADGPEGLGREIAPVVMNTAAADLVEDLEDYLAGKRRVLIVAHEADGQLRLARLLGRLDGAAAETFAELAELKETTALQLFEHHRGRTTNQTAWNNRLVQLVELRVARRRRDGRFWIYQPTVTT
jgi:hypothetical protein